MSEFLPLIPARRHFIKFPPLLVLPFAFSLWPSAALQAHYDTLDGPVVADARTALG